MEDILRLPTSLDPRPDDVATNEPAINSEQVQAMMINPESEEWKKECSRGLTDVWRIGRARLMGLGLK